MSIFEIPAQPGILPFQGIETLIATGAIKSDTPFDHDQVQPASLDLPPLNDAPPPNQFTSERNWRTLTASKSSVPSARWMIWCSPPDLPTATE